MRRLSGLRKLRIPAGFVPRLTRHRAGSDLDRSSAQADITLVSRPLNESIDSRDDLPVLACADADGICGPKTGPIDLSTTSRPNLPSASQTMR
jgi:hypothetical protein